MTEQEIIQMWRSGLDKYKIAEIYKRKYNQQVKIIRSSIRHRHDSKFITNTEALYIIERVIYKNIMKGKNNGD